MSILYDFDPETAVATEPVPSPCVGVCKMDEKAGWCAGCFRTIDELTAWSTASNQSKLQVWRLVKHRMF
ncbi:DUF1289 domain-containing protein [Undibacterium jejuense]|uniref:DUF1289 domain-containing protein n=1 Tax=Undibacterium jejuense TaxID=1344949 RepID=A0A923HQ67_9BURK|nr:DUF1289 domain-containing protein [Undibacterium jejuense]MBC3862703.1 DUF1289 domain-containing protein [Undibacterium jejuense]